jgi:hypothetical protein
MLNSSLPTMPQNPMMTHNDEMVMMTMKNMIEILVINTSLPPKPSTLSLAERCL